MNIFATIKEELRLDRVTYYSICINNDEESLFNQFINEHQGDQDQEELSIIRSWIFKIGNEIGAKVYRFRDESYMGGETKALPPSSLPVTCNLRLYCMRINDDIVILFNGAKKTKRTAQECDNVRPHFLLANRLSKVINAAFIDKEIKIDDEDGRLIYDDSLILRL